jgi:membrane fusion protein (multidrug efflux system)
VFKRLPPHLLILSALLCLTVSPAMAQPRPSGPPAVGVVKAERRPIIERTEITGRVQAPQRVDLVARVTAFLDEQLFEQGTTVRKGQLLYRLERGPFEADLLAKEAAVAQAKAQLEYADLALYRAEELLRKQVGSQVTADNARATQKSAAAQVKSAEAQLRASQINLEYTQIRSPIDGRIGRTSVTIGNMVGPTTGTLATVVSQDEMYVTFPVSVRRVLLMRDRNASKGGLDAVRLLLKLPNGNLYDQVGKLDFVDISVAQDTDTIILRGIIPNPVLPNAAGGDSRVRELTNDEFVTVLVEAVEPTQVLAVPRASVLSDQQGDYVFVVDADDIARQRRVRLGQSTTEMAAVADGLREGDRVVAEGIQRVRPNAKVAPAPVTGAVGSASPTLKRS